MLVLPQPPQRPDSSKTHNLHRARCQQVQSPPLRHVHRPGPAVQVPSHCHTKPSADEMIAQDGDLEGEEPEAVSTFASGREPRVQAD